METMDLNELIGANQSIKIVPSIEDSLRASGLNVDLEDNSKLWFEQLQGLWKTWKKSTNVENRIEIIFGSTVDAFRVALIYVIKCQDFKDCKPKTLPYFIIETLQKWSVKHGTSPEDSLKLPAFHVGNQQRSQNFLNLILKTYQVTTIKDTILPIVKDMIKNDNCKQASQVVIAMDLCNDIQVQDLLFPLVLQDKTPMIDDYLTECPSQLMPFLQFLDSLLDKKTTFREYAQTYIEDYKISHVKYEKIHSKPLGKFLARLCKKFNISIETCKNLSRNRTTHGLRYLIHKKYQDHTVSSSEWDDLVQDSLRQNSESAPEFIEMLLDYDKQEALKWVKHLKINENDLPIALREVSLNETEPTEDENWDSEIDSTDYYKLSIPEDHVVLIDTADQFDKLIIFLLDNCDVVSIDCEWKPSFGATQSRIAIIQIATIDKVYIIDTIKLCQQEYISLWYKFDKSFLGNAEIIKLGFGLEQDLREIKASVAGLSNIKVKGEGLLDLNLLWKTLIESGLSLPSGNAIESKGLSSLVQICFGLPLQKSEQCSNWEIRPLRRTQINYAALDAHVLIQIYDYLQKLCSEQGIDFEEISNNVMVENKNKSKNKKKLKVATRIQLSLIENQVHNPEKSVQHVKFLVEASLSSLLAYLRYCGIDSDVVLTTMLWHDVVNLAISEERFILVGKHKITPTRNYPQNNILYLGIDCLKNQMQNIFHTFHIKLEESDLLSRCIYCNKKKLKQLPAEEVTKICNEYQYYQSHLKVNSYVSDCEDDNNYDEFLEDSDCDADLYQIVKAPQCITSEGIQVQVTIDSDDVQGLASSHKPAILCEACGQLYSDEGKLVRSIKELVLSIFNK